jgi:hypothetical protein
MAVIGVGAPVAATMSLLEHVVSRVASLPGAIFLSEARRRSEGRIQPVPAVEKPD